MAWLQPVRFLLVALVTTLLLGLSSPSAMAYDSGGAVKLDTPKGEKCIRPTEWMRRNHMDFLKEKREETVREGVRIPDESLLNCKTCHVSREQFCDRCHSYVNVKPDCFDCHIYP